MLKQHIGHGPVDGGREPAHPVDLAHASSELLAGGAEGRQLEDAGARLTQRAPDAEQLVLRGVGARDQLAVDGAVPRSSREVEKPRAPARSASRTMARMASMSSAVAASLLGAPLAHDVGPHRAVGDLGADVDRPAPPLQRVEVLGEGLPLPLDPLGERRAGDVLDALHEADEPVVAVGLRPGRSPRRSCP